MIRSNYVQVKRAKATLVSRVYHRVSPARITRLRLGDTGYSLQKRITEPRLGDTVSSLQNRITKPHLRTSPYRNVVTMLVSESQ